VPTAKSAVFVQPAIPSHQPPARAARPSRVRRLAYTALGVVLGITLLVPAEALNAPAVSARSSANDCQGWNSTTRPPDYIRVLRRKSGRIERVPFRKYVVTVLGKEWPSYLPQAVVEAGAVAVKQYAWYHALGKPRLTRNGRCYDVRDGVGDQLYKPNRARVRQDHHNAVKKTWSVRLLKNGKLFMTGYRRGAKNKCGRDSTGWKLFARSATRCAYKGYDFRRILRTYYSPGLRLAETSSGAAAQASLSTSAQTRAAEARVIDDRSRRIAWRGSWRRIRSSAAHNNTLTYSGLAGSSATLRFVGRSLELVGRKGPRRGWVDIFINGRRKARVDLYAARLKDQTTFFKIDWRRSRTRIVRIKVVGTADRPRVDLDAILIR